MKKLMKVWIQRENTGFIDIDLPTSSGDLQSTIETFLGEAEDNPVYISDYEYLGNISYEDGEQMNLINEFTSVYELNKVLNYIIDSNNPDAAIALLIADMIRVDDIEDLDDLNGCIERFSLQKLDTDILNYNPKYDNEYYWIILDAVNPEFSGLLSSENAECYFDVKRFVEDTILGDATVTSTGYLVWYY